jgi:hypothetical protein
VHRRVSEMMDRLGARTRFQAGLLAARRGWWGQDDFRGPQQSGRSSQY